MRYHLLTMTIRIATYLILAAVVFTTVNSRPYEELFDCTGKADGIYVDPADNRGYYVCLGDHPMVHLICREGRIFDSALSRCVKANGEPDDKEEIDTTVQFVNSNSPDAKSIQQQISDALGNDDNDDKWPNFNFTDTSGKFKEEVKNIVLTENIFPESFVVIGVLNTEQSNN